MFIVSLTYKCDLSVVDKYLEKHVQYLKTEYSKGNFIASGRKVPRTGGIILAKTKNKEDLELIIKDDPFYKNNISEYQIIEFVPSMVAEGFEKLKE